MKKRSKLNSQHESKLHNIRISHSVLPHRQTTHTHLFSLRGRDVIQALENKIQCVMTCTSFTESGLTLSLKLQLACPNQGHCPNANK